MKLDYNLFINIFQTGFVKLIVQSAKPEEPDNSMVSTEGNFVVRQSASKYEIKS